MSNQHEFLRRRDDWSFGPSHPFSDDEARWWARHEPTVDRWLSELEQASDPWWQSAEHAASCLVARIGEPLDWEAFDVAAFLFVDLWEGGTVTFFGSAEIFFDQLVEALRRFADDGLIEAAKAEAWLAQMRGARADFLRCYDAATSEDDALAIARRHLVMRKRSLQA